MSKSTHIDYFLLFTTIILIAFGIAIVSTTSFPYSLKNFGNSWYYIIHQLMGLGIGIIFFILFAKIPLKFFQKHAQAILLLNIIATVLVFVPGIGLKIGGARRWVKFPIVFQPSEFLKVSFLIYLSAWLSKRTAFQEEKPSRKKTTIVKRPKRNSKTTLVAFIIILFALTALLLLQPDMSTMLIIAAAAIFLYFISQTSIKHLLLILLLFGGSALALARFSSYRFSRILSFFSPLTDPLGKGYQLRQSLIAIGSGQVFGNQGFFSLGLGLQKFGFLPSAMSDSIFAVIGEEMGFIGSLALIILFIFFAWRGFKISIQQTSFFPKLLAFSITFWIIFQASLNMGCISGILPISGIPLPFISYGGSHIIAELMGVGLLLNISRQRKSPLK